MAPFGMHDYIFINADLEVLGRKSEIDYGNSEKHGSRLGRGTTLQEAQEIAGRFTHSFMKYGVRYSEQLNLEG